MSFFKYSEFKFNPKEPNISLSIKDETTASKTPSKSKISTDDSFIDTSNYIYETPCKKERPPYIPSTPRKENKCLTIKDVKIKGKNLLELFDAL